MVKYLEEDVLNVGFGVLNPLSDSLSGKYFDPDNTTSLQAIRKATTDHYSEAILQKAGRFVGIVLRVEGTTKDVGYINANSWASTASELIDKSDKSEGPNLLQLRVRIPEFHAHLPIPETLPDFSVVDPSHNTINMYPIFIAQNEDLSFQVPEPGSLVWVDFQNRSTMSGPVYYGMVRGSGMSPSRGTLLGSAASSFAEGQTTSGANMMISTVDYSSELTTVTLSSAVPIAPPGFTFNKANLKHLKQNRVRRFAYGNCKREGPSLVPLPGGAKGHPLLADRLEAMNELWRRYAVKNNLLGEKVPKGNGNGVEEITSTLNVSNGFRDKKSYSLDNEGFRKWCKSVVNYYNTQNPPRNYTCRQASVLRAFASPHETGLAIDFSNNGLRAVSKTMSTQVKSPAFVFLVKYAWLFGFYPYNGETWHWELQVPRESWKTGEEFAGNPKYGEMEPLEIISTKEFKEMQEAGADLTLGDINNTFFGAEYDWLAGEEFEYAIWVDEKVKATGIKTSDGSFAGIRTWTPGSETFRLPRGIGA